MAYISVTLVAAVLQVHIKTKAVTPVRLPDAEVAVVCAAAVRAGNDVIMFSMCGSTPNRLGSTLVIKSKVADPLSPGMLVYKRQGDAIVVSTRDLDILYLCDG